MNCSECQNRIFDGELDRDAVVHLTECEDCRALDREVRLNAAALAGFRDEVLPVRAPRRRWPWIAAAAAAAAAIVAMIAWPTPAPAPAPAVPVAKVEPLTVAPAFPAAPRLAPTRRARPTRRKPEPPPAEAEPLMVKFFTDDPDIVIYWQIDPPKGEVGL